MTDAKPVTDGDWTLHYTIGDVITGPVYTNDLIDTSDGAKFTALGGTSPQRVNDTGTIVVDAGIFSPRTVGTRWVHKGGGLGG